VPFHWRLGRYRDSYYAYVFGCYGVGGIGSRLAFGCMRSVGCVLSRESVASWGV